jgi:hypothetical protein
VIKGIRWVPVDELGGGVFAAGVWQWRSGAEGGTGPEPGSTEPFPNHVAVYNKAANDLEEGISDGLEPRLTEELNCLGIPSFDLRPEQSTAGIDHPPADRCLRAFAQDRFGRGAPDGGGIPLRRVG